MQAWFNYQAEKKKVVQFKSGMLGDAQKVMDGWYINTNVVKPTFGCISRPTYL